MARPEFKWSRSLYKMRRGAVRVLSKPAQKWPEGPRKEGLERWILRGQNSLPTELSVNPGDVVVQVGTPNPSTLRRFRRRIGSAGQLVIVEAMPDNQKVLAETIKQGGYNNVHLVCAAAASKAGKGSLQISPHRGDHRMELEGVTIDNDLRPENVEMGSMEVELVRLDDALAALGIDQFDYLSVTVNGAEGDVLRGATNLLKNSSVGARVFAKGHARDSSGMPIHQACRKILEGSGYRVVVTKGEPSSTLDPTWRWRAGDLFAWKD